MKLSKDFMLRILALPSLSLLLFLCSCEREITLDLADSEDLIIVQGSIYEDSIPIIILTRNVPFYGTTQLNANTDLFIKNAEVKVWDENDTVILPQLNIPVEMDSSQYDFIVYTNPLSDFKGEVGHTYHLQIIAGEKELYARTYIPAIIPVDSLWWNTKTLNDTTYAQLFCLFEDPDTTGNYYRYFTKRNSEPMYPGLSSVFDDAVVNGTSFQIPVTRAYDRNADIPFNSYGLFEPGDTVTFRVCGIDQASYRFWQTLENNSNSGGPFASPVVVKSNITGAGGFGSWCGYSISDNTLILQ